MLLEMSSLMNNCEVQKLNEKIAALSMFIPKAAKKCQIFFQEVKEARRREVKMDS